MSNHVHYLIKPDGLSIHGAKSGRLSGVTIDSANAKKARRVCVWGSRLFPLGLPKNSRKVLPCQSDLFVEKGCQVTKAGNPHFRPEFVRRAAAFTTANA
jgi:hypothetical protein